MDSLQGWIVCIIVPILSAIGIIAHENLLIQYLFFCGIIAKWQFAQNKKRVNDSTAAYVHKSVIRG